MKPPSAWTGRSKCPIDFAVHLRPVFVDPIRNTRGVTTWGDAGDAPGKDGIEPTAQWSCTKLGVTLAGCDEASVIRRIRCEFELGV